MSDDAGVFDAEVHKTEDIDWVQLWQEFGFDSQDAAGNVYASQTQLYPAIEVSEQNIAGDPNAHISVAVDMGDLVPIEKEDDKGNVVVVGFHCPAAYDGGGGDERQ